MAKPGFGLFLAPVSGTIFLCCLSYASSKRISRYTFSGVYFVNIYLNPESAWLPGFKSISRSTVGEMMRLANLPCWVVSVAFLPWGLKPWHHLRFLPFPASQPYFLLPSCTRPLEQDKLCHPSDHRRGLKLTPLFPGSASPGLPF